MVRLIPPGPDRVQTAPALPPGGGRRTSGARSPIRPTHAPRGLRPVTSTDRPVPRRRPQISRRRPRAPLASPGVGPPDRGGLACPTPPTSARCWSAPTPTWSTTCSGGRAGRGGRDRRPRRPVRARPVAGRPARRWSGQTSRDQPVPARPPRRAAAGRPATPVWRSTPGRETGWAVVSLPDEEAWLAERLASVAVVPRPGPCVGVVGGRGGAGASTLAAALAVTAAAGRTRPARRPRPAGRWHRPAARPRGRARAAVVRPGCGVRSGLRVGAGRVAAAARRRVGAVVRPRPTPARVARGRAVGARVGAPGVRPRRGRPAPPRGRRGRRSRSPARDPVLLVVPAEVRAVAAAGAGRGRGRPAGRRPAGGRPRPVAVAADGPAVARLLGLPLAGWLRPEPGLASPVERGEPPGRSGRGPLGRRCVAELFDELLPARPDAPAVVAA